jgi:hypothetical protein
MRANERETLIAPCGIDCGACELYLCKDDQQLTAYLVSKGIAKDKLPCSGCRDLQGCCPVIGSRCATHACVSDKQVEFCFQCNEFPCSKLQPSADRANVLPHNLKVFNLCTIQRDGVKSFVMTSAGIKKKYYKGKMEIGNGPQIAE